MIDKTEGRSVHDLQRDLKQGRYFWTISDNDPQVVLTFIQGL